MTVLVIIALKKNYLYAQKPIKHCTKAIKNQYFYFLNFNEKSKTN